ncbi:MAG: glucose dehydrogenase [Candidatus Latescibacteria bacterium]|nr:glucose dehydrogenase [bacterium]MBD3425278.1 glucose dehydrogenase [Candidatus Latescibacterota bacterium]
MPSLEIVLIEDGFNTPVQVVDPGDGSGRLFVVEQPGYIRILSGDSVLSEPFLDLSSQVSYGGEQGLLSMVFSPDFSSNGHFYVDYTRTGDGATVLARYSIDPQDSNRAESASGENLLVVSQPYPNHNGGMTAFGPDGYLYISIGDGGSGGDPEGNGQDPETLLGSILRLDVESGVQPYDIPGDNPFAGHAEFREEIWAYGLRNPWRFSFDTQTGDIYIGDVGQTSWEEIDMEPAGSPGGLNYGWNIMEGFHCYQADTCDRTGLTEPVFEYGHNQGCSVTGGYIYRGNSYPEMEGIYFFADYCNGTIWGMMSNGTEIRTEILLDTDLQIVSFGEDADGEIYIIDLGGEIYRLAGSD